LDVRQFVTMLCYDFILRARCYSYVYIILSVLYIKRFHTLFVSLYVPIAYYSVFDSMQLIAALKMNMTIINPPAQSSKLVYEFAYREPVR